jgi:3-oxosteroid 1-dehydrogenase
MSNQHEKTLIVIGAGLGGMATALAASQHGYAVTIFESGEKAGGAASYSGGQVWVPANHVARNTGMQDSFEEAVQYIEGLATAFPEILDREAMISWLRESPRAAEYFERIGAVTWDLIPNFADYFQDAPGAKEDGRYITAVFDGEKLNGWRDKLHISPHFPIGQTYDDLFSEGWRELEVSDGDHDAEHANAVAKGVSAFGARAEDVAGDSAPSSAERPRDLLSFGTGIAASFLARVVEDDRISVKLQHRVTDLITEHGRVVGVRADADGTAVEARGPVVIATSGLDWDAELVEEYFDLEWSNSGSVAPNTLRGDGARLARSVGGEVIKFPPRTAPLLTGYPAADGESYEYCLEHAYPHSFIVDSTGKRFCDDSYYRDIVWQSLDPENPRTPFYLIWDEQHHQRYGMGATPPGGEYRSEIVFSGSTLQELGAKLGIDGEQLEATAAQFNGPAAQGKDPQFGRGSRQPVRRYSGDPAHPLHPNVGPVTDAPFFGMKLHLLGTGISISGIRFDPVGRVVGADGEAIPGLYGAGSAGAFTTSGSGYNSGYALSRAITHGLLIAEHLDQDAALLTSQAH